MSQITKLSGLWACTLAASLVLGACGGGDGEPPPPPTAPVATTPPPPPPDTTAPTVTIANDTPAATATGPVTFTFVFSEDVGVSFTADDVVVTGGAAGAFTRVPGGTQATLVVTPTPNTAGQMTVSVAAGKFTDIAGNANTASATGSKDYDVRPPSAPTVAAPTPPARAAADVLSVYSDAYTQIAGVDPFPNWGQSTVVSEITVAGNKTRKYASLNYEGTDWSGNPINVSAMTKLHIDLWTPDVTSVKVSIISAGKENPVTLTPTLASWNSVDIDLTQYNVPDKTAIIQLKIEGTPPGGTLFLDNIYFWRPAAGGGGSVAPIIFSSGFAANNLTNEGGAYFGYSGSNQDGFSCSSAANCGSGSGGSGATSFFYSYYQTPTPATALYVGAGILAPGVTAISGTGDTAGGVQIAGQTTINFTFNNNPEWQASGTNNFGVLLTLGKYYNVGTAGSPAACNIKLLAVVTPLNGGAAAAYAIPLSSFAVIQPCGTSNTTPALALASAKVVSVDFQGDGGTAALPPVNGKTTGANLSVATAGLYPTTVALTGGISFQPPAAPPASSALTFSSGFAAGNLTNEGGAYYGYSGSNLDGFNCSNPAWCGSGNGGSGATSFFFSYYQTPSPATALYVGAGVLGPGVAAISGTGDTAGGVQVAGQTTINFTYNNNPEWQASGTNNFGVLLTLGKYYNVGSVGSPAACNIKLLAVVTPLNGGAATAYAIPLSSFAVIQPCNTSNTTPALALASAKVVSVDFQGDGGTAALPPVNGKTTGANLSVATAGLYPTTVALTGGISFQP